jgi:hypothetical protein
MTLKMSSYKAYEVTRERLEQSIKNVDYDARTKAACSVILTEVPVALRTEEIDTVYDVCISVVAGATTEQRQAGVVKARSFYGSRQRNISRPDAVAILIRNVSFMHQWRFQNPKADSTSAEAYFFEHLTFIAICMDIYLSCEGQPDGHVICAEVCDD